ncbi:MAG: DUF3644 domain-containing protein [Terriglobales bacterium]
MAVAWTALFHAIFFKRRKPPSYRMQRPRRFVKLDGERRAWELSECVCQLYANEHPPERKNLEFFLKLRNKIEHRQLPALDREIFGECQALLLNFEADRRVHARQDAPGIRGRRDVALGGGAAV